MKSTITRTNMIRWPRFIFVSSVVGLLFIGFVGQTLRGMPQGVLPPEVLTVLRQIKAADKDQLAVSEEDGRFLRVTAVTRNAKRALEIGAADGYSAIWIGLGLRETGG